MGIYIDAEKLLAEIEQLNSLVPYENNDRHDDGLHDAYKAVKNVIASLEQEQPEVDLDNMIEKYFKGWTETDEGIACHYQYVDLNTCYGIARHFYELGLNSRKED